MDSNFVRYLFSELQMFAMKLLRDDIFVFFLMAISLLPGCGQNDNNSWSADLKVYEENSRYSSVLKACVTSTADNSCELSTLPLIGQEFSNPTIDNIMERVVVSHDWMGRRFREVLEKMPRDTLLFMKPLTSIVIDGDIRPSHYSSLTGAIYIDPQYLWLTNDEKETVAKEPDYRSSFGSDLKFNQMTRYVKGNSYAYRYYSLSGNSERTLDDIVMPLSRVLFHELAHANDFFPHGKVASLGIDGTTVYEAAWNLGNVRISELLTILHPLNSTELKGLARVLYAGYLPTTDQINMTADYVGARFSADGANDHYSYSTVREDVAMLVEEALMKYYFDVDRDIAFTDKPVASGAGCDEYTVRWGRRGSIGAPVVKERAIYVMNNILEGKDFSNFFANLGNSINMNPGYSWCQNINLGSTALHKEAIGDEMLRLHTDSLPDH